VCARDVSCSVDGARVTAGRTACHEQRAIRRSISRSNWQLAELLLLLLLHCRISCIATAGFESQHHIDGSTGGRTDGRTVAVDRVFGITVLAVMISYQQASLDGSTLSQMASCLIRECDYRITHQTSLKHDAHETDDQYCVKSKTR